MQMALDFGLYVSVCLDISILIMPSYMLRNSKGALMFNNVLDTPRLQLYTLVCALVYGTEPVACIQ